jgi:hypothetical protein
VLVLARRMEHQFVGVGGSELVQIRQLALRARTLQLLGVIQDTSADSKTACAQYLQHLTTHQQLLTHTGVKPDLCTSSLMDAISSFQSCDTAMVHQVLVMSLRQHSSSVLRLSNQLQKVKAVITQPTGGSEVAVKFSAGLTTAVSLVARLYNLRDMTRLRIQVTYPNQQTQLIVPAPGDVRQLSDLQHKLNTRVILSHSVWSEPSCVLISLVLLCPQDIDDITGSLTTTGSKHTPVLELCKPASVSIAPVAPRKV